MHDGEEVELKVSKAREKSKTKHFTPEKSIRSRRLFGPIAHNPINSLYLLYECDE